MRTLRTLVVVVVLVVATSGCRWIVRASVDPGGNQGNGSSYEPRLSDDGRYVAFESDATNLVPNDLNGQRDVFVRDNRTGAVERVFEQAQLEAISGDGRYVSASDYAPCRNLGTGQALFIRDRQTGLEDCALPYPSAEAFSVSETARFVAGTSALAATVGVLDRQTGQTEDVPLPDGFRPPVEPTISISDDGRYVALEMFSFDPCVPRPDNPECKPLDTEVVVHDRVTGTTERVPMPPNFLRATDPAISGDGLRVAFYVTLAVTPLREATSAWVYDRPTQSAEPVSVYPDGTPAESWGAFDAPGISDDGRFITFYSDTGLDPSVPYVEELYVRDTVENQTSLVDRNTVGAPALALILDPAISGDGRYVAFSSNAERLVGDDTNGVFDVFVRANPTPAVDAVTPASVSRGTTTTISVNGVGFAPHTTIAISGQGVTVGSVTRISEHRLSVAITVDAAAPAGARTLSVANVGTGPGPAAGDTGWCYACLTVT